MTAPAIDFIAAVDWAPVCQIAVGASDDNVTWRCCNTAEYYAEVHCAPCWRPKLICQECLYVIEMFAHRCDTCGYLEKSSDRVRNVKDI